MLKGEKTLADKKIHNEKDIREMRETARRVFLDPSTPPVRSVVRVISISLLVLLLAALVIVILYQLTFLLFLIVLSVLLAYLLDPLVKTIRRPFKNRNLDNLMPRPAAIGLSYLIVFILISIVIAYLAPIITTQIRDFTENLPNYTNAIQERISAINNRFDQLMISEEIQKQINQRIGEVIQYIGAVFVTGFVGGYAVNFLTYLPWLLIVPVLAFFFLKDASVYYTSFLRCFPVGHWRARAESLLTDVNSTLAAYTRAQLISCIIIGVTCTIGFSLIGLDYALLLGILAGIFEFIPLLGPLTIGTIAVLVGASSDNPWHALWTAVFLITLRLIHDYITYPRIVRDGIHLHPLAVILSVLAGEQIAGIPGVFLSIPIVAIFTVLYKHLVAQSGRGGVIKAIFNTIEKDETKVEVIEKEEVKDSEKTEKAEI